MTRNEPYIGIFNDSFPPIIDGVTLTVENYVRWLNARGEHTCVVTPWNPERVESPCRVMRYFSLPIRGRHPYRYGYPKLDPFIWRSLRNTPFKLVHSHCPFSSGRLAVYAAKKRGVPLIGTFHSKYRADLEHSFRHTPWMVTIIMKRILNFFDACDQVWIPQASVEETVREYGYNGPLTVVENGNDMASLIPEDRVDELRSASRRELGISDSTVSLLFVGQHIHAKGIMLIAEALDLLNKRGADFRMNYIGTGYALSELEQYVRDHGLEHMVKVNGPITDRSKLCSHYAAADLFLFPSFYDNAPLVVREAAALRTPAILLKGSTAAEVITDGDNGYLVENSARDYADIIEHLCADREGIRKAGKNARSTLTRTWEDVVGEVIVRYNEVMDKGKIK